MVEKKHIQAHALLTNEHWPLIAEWIADEQKLIKNILATRQAKNWEDYHHLSGRHQALDDFLAHLNRLKDQYEERIAAENRASEPES